MELIELLPLSEMIASRSLSALSTTSGTDLAMA